MKRAHGIDVLECPKCRGRLRPIATITQPDVIRKFLESIGVPADPPTVWPARPPPQAEMPFVCSL